MVMAAIAALFMAERGLQWLRCRWVLRGGPGEVLTDMGPSGLGKSTLLAAIIGAVPAGFSASGRVMLNGGDLGGAATAKRRIGMLFRDDLLFSHLSVGGNLAFALPAAVHGRTAWRSAVEAVLAQAGMAGLADRDPATLCGGQRARVALMRTPLAKPAALLPDEPFSRLDSALRDQIRRFALALALALARNRGLPVLLVTYDEGNADAAGGLVVRPGNAGAAIQPSALRASGCRNRHGETPAALRQGPASRAEPGPPGSDGRRHHGAPRFRIRTWPGNG